MGLRGLVIAFLSWGVSLSGTALADSLARAPGRPSLVVIEYGGRGNPIYRQMLERIGAVILTNQLSRHYSRIEVLTESRANSSAFFQTIRSQAERGPVDVVVLTHGYKNEILLEEEILTENEIRAQGNLPGLRMVYMIACNSSTLVDAWVSVGAQVAVGHQDINSLPGFFFPRFVRRWSEGYSVADAARDAYYVATRSALQLSPYISDGDLLGAQGVARSEPVIRGANIDIHGQIHPMKSLAIDISALPQAQAPSKEFHHTAFERLGIEILGAIFPQVKLSPAAIPTTDSFLQKTRDIAWSELRDSFPLPLSEVQGAIPGEGGAIWMDGDSLRFLFAPIRNWQGSQIGVLLDSLLGVRFNRIGDELRVSAYFKKEATIPFKGASLAKSSEVYGVHLPEALRFEVAEKDGVVVVRNIASGKDSLRLLARLPVPGAGSVYLRYLILNLETGRLELSAGILGNVFSVIVHG